MTLENQVLIRDMNKNVAGLNRLMVSCKSKIALQNAIYALEVLEVFLANQNESIIVNIWGEMSS